MDSYFSVICLGLFVPVTVIVYQIAPRRARPFVLLAASYLFFWSLSGALLAFLLLSTVSIWAVGLALGALLDVRDRELAAPGADRRSVRRLCRRRMRTALAIGLAVNLGVLAALKYLPFFSRLAAPLLACLGIGAPTGGLGVGIPIGISFYTLSAVSYLVDVYREQVPAERRPLRLALFLAFFPQIMEGPICRFGQTADALWAGRPVTPSGLYAGSVRILWGIAKKMIVADRVNILVKTVFANHGSYDGGVIALAAVLYTVQLYCDFSGTMDFAVGMGRIFGVSMPENFRQPFASRTAAEFWQRWHVTLGTWLRDYVFYPVSLSRPAKRLTTRARRLLGNRMGPLAASAVPLACVWFLNGLWHGAGGQYLLFGLYYFVIIWLGGMAGPVSARLCALAGIDRDGRAWHAWQRVRTLAVVFAGELVFRSAGAHDALAMLGGLLERFSLASFFDGTVLSLGMDAADFGAVAAAVAVLAVVGHLRERGVHLLDGVRRAPAVPRTAAVFALVLAIIVFGAYGPSYIPVDPMYAQF